MKKWLKIGITVAAVIGTLMVSCWVTGFNSIVDKDEAVLAAWGEVQNQYQRRSDLIPNFVATVKGQADFEKDTLQAVVDARSKVAGITVDASMLDDPDRFKQYEAAQNRLSSSLSRLLVVSENYPTLHAHEGFRDLRVELEGTENRITVARKRYVDSVSAYNSQVRKFPSAIGASLRGLSTRPSFEAITPGAEVAPTVQF